MSSKKWDASKDGFPWTPKKMRDAISDLRNGASITFAFGYEKLNRIKELDENVFSIRNDLELHIWSVEKNNKFTDEQLQIISSLKFVKKLQINGFKNSTLPQLEEFTNLEKLTIAPQKKLDIDFLSKLPNLTYLFLAGNFESFKPISSCKKLQNLYLQQVTLNDLGFIEKLPMLAALMIDSSRVNCSFKPLERTRIIDLMICSITNLSDVSFLSKMINLEKLRVDASKIEYLPDLKNLIKLENIELVYMKVLKNPEVLLSVRNLKILTLREINTKLSAEQFDFLTNMDSLEKVDFRFIDYNKRRISKLNDIFTKKGKNGLLVK